MNFFSNKLTAAKYLDILKSSPKKINSKFVLGNFGSLLGDKAFFRFLICFELLKKIKNINGDIIEFGIWNGNNLFSLKKMMDYLKIKKKLFGYDDFGGFKDPKTYEHIEPPDTDLYIGNKNYVNFIIKFFKFENIKIIKDDIMNLDKYKFRKLSLIYIDCDLYKTTDKILNYLKNNLSVGGIIVFDEGICGEKHEEPKALKEFYNQNKKYFKIKKLKKNYQPDVYLEKIK